MKYLTNSGLSYFLNKIKTYIASQLNSKAAVIHTHTYSEITDLPNGYVVDSTLDGTSSNAVSNSAVVDALDGYVPRSGGAVLNGFEYSRNNDNSVLNFNGGTRWDTGAQLQLFGKDTVCESPGAFILYATLPNGRSRFQGNPNGTLTWNGQGIQTTSDQRLKQQIAEIDDKLLDAWEDVDLVQFKYNDAVDQKGDNARLHTGYVVQQIDKACKSHGVDVSEYGLYCHEEYPQETEEVEVEQADGTKTKERKVIREASEHYSLRYTEVYAVECMYLRRENSRLKEKLASLEERLEKLEKAEK